MLKQPEKHKPAAQLQEEGLAPPLKAYVPHPHRLFSVHFFFLKPTFALYIPPPLVCYT